MPPFRIVRLSVSLIARFMNVALYPTFQKYFRTHKPRFLAVWGKNDPFFLPRGAKAFERDIPSATVRFFDTGHPTGSAWSWKTMFLLSISRSPRSETTGSFDWPRKLFRKSRRAVGFCVTISELIANPPFG
jgi:hypothetical protein